MILLGIYFNCPKKRKYTIFKPMSVGLAIKSAQSWDRVGCKVRDIFFSRTGSLYDLENKNKKQNDSFFNDRFWIEIIFQNSKRSSSF